MAVERARVRKLAVAAVLAAATALTGASCEDPPNRSDRGAPSRTPDRTPDRTPSKTPGKSPGKTPSKTPEASPETSPGKVTTPPPKTPYPGQAQVKNLRPDNFRDGIAHVGCTGIDAGFTVLGYGGRTKWEVLVLDFEPRADQREFGSVNIPRNVVVEPRSGVLEAGRSQPVKIRGTFGGGFGGRPHFWVLLSSPERDSPTREVVHFQCLGALGP
ncbi:hypothetical protein [Streptomyces sp. NBC_00091]|uniref:hypothetical protein n=1 Tax=Streptomyces sp. NBC_00091 TaxID=2975648 RepID=UPI002258FE44|nr:hypothetical protein [Streptomyces sp. NBC_00091]MCX5376246.1 hypothetical protein [Streptomyces sp. NBC_00091]